MATFSANQEAKIKKQVKGVLNTCKEILKNAPNNGCAIKNIDKKLVSL
jgi:hypothetical protein